MPNASAKCLYTQRLYTFLLCAALLCTTLLFTQSLPAHAAAKTKDAPKSQGAIILSVFGSSDPAVQKSLTAFHTKVQAAFPQYMVEFAYTATRAREAMRARGQEAPSVAQALTNLPEKKIHTAVVQSLHIMPGYEYHNTLQVAEALEGLPKGLTEVCVGAPLLSNAQSLDEVAKALLAALPERKDDEGVLYVGHGTDHIGGLAYPALQYALHQHDSRAFIVTLESTKFKGGAVPSLEAGLKALRASKVTKVTLVPLMTVAGVHVKDDIAGTEEDSIRSQLQKEGYTVTLIHKGLLDMPAVQDIFISRIAQAVKHCKK